MCTSRVVQGAWTQPFAPAGCPTQRHAAAPAPLQTPPAPHVPPAAPAAAARRRRLAPPWPHRRRRPPPPGPVKCAGTLLECCLLRPTLYVWLAALPFQTPRGHGGSTRHNVALCPPAAYKTTKRWEKWLTPTVTRCRSACCAKCAASRSAAATAS